MNVFSAGRAIRPIAKPGGITYKDKPRYPMSSLKRKRQRTEVKGGRDPGSTFGTAFADFKDVGDNPSTTADICALMVSYVDPATRVMASDRVTYIVSSALSIPEVAQESQQISARATHQAGHTYPT